MGGNLCGEYVCRFDCLTICITVPASKEIYTKKVLKTKDLPVFGTSYSLCTPEEKKKIHEMFIVIKGILSM